MTYVVVDASIWVSRLVPQDEFHDRCLQWLSRQRSNDVTLTSPSFLLAEVAGAISRRTRDNQLAERTVEALKGLPGLRLIEMNQTVIENAARLAARLGLRGADAIYVAVASHLNIPLATLDEDQREKAAKVVMIETI